MTIDANQFNFDAMKEAVGVDPFAKDTNTRYAKDERFYMLSKDKDGNGAALIRFLPDANRNMIQKIFKINTTITKNGKKRFVSLFSPSTIGAPCPFQEKWQQLWNEGDKDEAKVYGRGTRYVTNIKVLKDPANKENEGKIFLYEISGAMKDKIQNAVDPSEQDRSLGAEPKELFNPLQGNSFRLVAKKGSNNQINYDNSEVISEVTAIYASAEEAINDIKENTHSLSDLLKPESFTDYAELQNKLAWVTFADQATPSSTLQATVAEVKSETPEVQPAAEVTQSTVEATPEVTQKAPASKAQTLDSLLDGLV